MVYLLLQTVLALALGSSGVAERAGLEPCNHSLELTGLTLRYPHPCSTQDDLEEGPCQTHVLIQRGSPTAFKLPATSLQEEHESGVYAPSGLEGIVLVSGLTTSAHSVARNALLESGRAHARNELRKPGFPGIEGLSANLPDVPDPVTAMQRPKVRIGIVPSGDPLQAEHSNDTSICQQNIFARPTLCPDQCPFAAEMKDKFCHFRCVTADKCGLLGTMPNATIPDENLRFCRHCAVEACRTCVPGKPGLAGNRLERCIKCMPGYYLTLEGTCLMRCLWIFVSIGVIVALAGCVGVWWYGLLLFRPNVNQAGIDYGLECRLRSGLQDADTGQPYPLSTNLCKKNVAGAGTMCLFRFQAALIFWGAGLLAIWISLSCYVSSDILVLGNREATTPQLLCAVVAWGHSRQFELMWVKILWCALAYLFSFIGALVYAYQQTKLFASIDAETTSMSDFAGVLRGLPNFEGSDNVETLVKEAVEQATGQTIVGVSIVWAYDDEEHAVKTAIEKSLLKDEPADMAASPYSSPSKFEWVNTQVLEMWEVHPDSSSHVTEEEAKEAKAMLQGMKSTDTAFVIFENEAGRDLGIASVEERGVQLQGATCSLAECEVEPREVIWENFSVPDADRFGMFLSGCLLVFGGCIAWTCLLYLPYAHYVASFSYANGDEPGVFSDGVFCALVVGSQIGLFVCSNMAAENSRFRYQDEKQRMYTLLYTFALILNLFLDIILQAYLSYIQMVGVGAHTADGVLLGQLGSFQEIFESYPMQKSLGNLLFTYCWPCTFFVPFLFEPIISQWAPKHLGTLLVRADPRIKGLKAAKALELGEMEQGRYADIMFNVICLGCIPFIAPAYLHLTIAALVASHGYIYFYDHVKVLRYVGSFSCSTNGVHDLGEKLFAVPVSLLVGAMVFKGSQLSGTGELGSGYLKGWSLGGAMMAAMCLHLMIHLAALKYIHANCKGSVDRSQSMHTYKDAAKSEEATFFSLNPVHCLRSNYGLIDSGPAVSFYTALKA